MLYATSMRSGTSVRVWAGVLLSLLLAACLVFRPQAYGVSRTDVAIFWLFVLLGVAAPGLVVCSALGLYRRDPLLLVGQGFALGFVLQGVCFWGGRALGLGVGFSSALPFLASGATAILARRRTGLPKDGGVASGGRLGLLLVALVGCMMQSLATTRLLGKPLPVDLLFHAGNAAELLHRWPLEDPRAAGIPLNYTVLAYALPAAVSGIGGLPVADALHGLAPLFWITLLALQTSNAGRVLLGDPLAATIGTLVVLLHEDPGGFLGLGRGAFSSHLPTALYGSPTTVCGLVLLASLAIVVGEVLSTPRRARGLWPLLFFFALGASMTKATVVPAAAGGAGLLAAWSWLRGRLATARTALLCALTLGLAALPFTLRLGAGETSYREILRWSPGAIIQASPFTAWAAHALGVTAFPAAEGPSALVPAPAWFIGLIAPFWLAGYLGLAAAGAWAWLFWRPTPPSDGERWALGVVVAGAAPAVLLAGHGLSQLFFLYNGQLLLGILAGSGIAATMRAWPQARGKLIVLALAALPSLGPAKHLIVTRPAHDRREARSALPGDVAEYAAGLSWLRTHASEGAVVFADNPSLLLSAFGECRMYYETGLFTPRGWQQKWEGTDEPFPERAALQEALLRRTGPDVVAATRRLFPPPVKILVVADSVQSRVEGGLTKVDIGPVRPDALLPPRWFERVFANRAMHVYRLAPEAGKDF
jgi:hypothetical protein